MCSYRVGGVEGSCVMHLIVEFYTVVMLLTFILIIVINTKNCSLSIVLTATDQKPQKSVKR